LQLFFLIAIFAIMHTIIWYSTNWQLVKGVDKNSALMFAVVLAIPISLLAFYGTKIAYEAFSSAWSVRLFAFGMSYITFPILTWVMLDESPFNTKTMICISLSFIIIAVQLFWRNT